MNSPESGRRGVVLTSHPCFTKFHCSQPAFSQPIPWKEHVQCQEVRLECAGHMAPKPLVSSSQLAPWTLLCSTECTLRNVLVFSGAGGSLGQCLWQKASASGRDLGEGKGWAYSIRTLWKGQNIRKVPSATEDCREKLCLSTYGSTRSVVLRPDSQ